MKDVYSPGVRRAADALAFGAGDLGAATMPGRPRYPPDSREQGRETKQECVRNNNQSNASCRHDKRENRREGRQEARDEKNGKSACSGISDRGLLPPEPLTPPATPDRRVHPLPALYS